jgi:hypothetical protein
MAFITALMHTSPAFLFVAGAAFLVMFGSGSDSDSTSTADDDNSDYENASWNPSSVNYNG